MMGCWCGKSDDVNTKNVVLLILGLDNSGKTTVVKRLTKQSTKNVVPTVGFATYDLRHKGCNVSLYDLGGGHKIRDIWKQYYADAHGIIFVVDSADIERLKECKKVLQDTLGDSKVKGKPVLLLANKQDLPSALDELDIVENLKLEQIVNRFKCPTLVELCVATNPKTKNNKTVEEGFAWLLRNIIKNYPTLNNRVLVDVSKQNEIEEFLLQKRRRQGTNRSQDDSSSNYSYQPKHVFFSTFSKNIQESSQPQPQNMAVLPTVTNRLPVVHDNDDDDDDDDVVTTVFKNPSNLEKFFEEPNWGSTEGLLENSNKRLSKNFLLRPRSSEPSSDQKPKTSKKNKKEKRNKVVPFNDANFSNHRPLPTVFDPTYETEVQPILNGNGIHFSQSKEHNQEIVLNVITLEHG